MNIGRPCSDVKRKVFSMYGSEEERSLLKILFALMTDKFVEDDDLFLAWKFFNRVKFRFVHIKKNKKKNP